MVISRMKAVPSGSMAVNSSWRKTIWKTLATIPATAPATSPMRIFV